jgi:hypothetical protein
MFLQSHTLIPGVVLFALAVAALPPAQAQNIIEPDDTLGSETSVLVPLNNDIDLIQGEPSGETTCFTVLRRFRLARMAEPISSPRLAMSAAFLPALRGLIHQRFQVS